MAYVSVLWLFTEENSCHTVMWALAIRGTRQAYIHINNKISHLGEVAR